MPPTFPVRGVEIVQELYGLNRHLAEGNDPDRRLLTRAIAGQFAFEFGPDWGTKSADPTRPPSKDSLVKKEGGKLWSWDWQDGDTREPQVKAGDTAEDVTGQHFIAVEPIDYLELSAPAPTPAPIPDPDPAIATFEARIKRLEQHETYITDVLRLHFSIPHPHPAYVGRLFGAYKIRVTPEPLPEPRHE